MHSDRFISGSFKIFFNFNPLRLVFLFGVTLVQGLTQGLSIVLLIPMLSLLDPANVPMPDSTWPQMLNAIFHSMGGGPTLPIILGLFTICLTFAAFLTYIQTILQANYQQDFAFEMRKRLFRKILSSDWEFLNGKSKHSHIQVLTTEIPKMSTYYYYFLTLASKLIFSTAYIAVALTVSIPFTILVTTTGFVFSLLLGKHIRNSKLIGNLNIQVFRNMLKRIDDFWQTVKIAKVHQSEQFYSEKYDETNRQMLDFQKKQVRNKALPQLLFTLAGILTLVLVVYIGYGIVKLPLSSLFALILLFARIFPSITGINNDLNAMVSYESSVRMVLDMDRSIGENEIAPGQQAGKIEIQHQLEIVGLNFGYQPGKMLFKDFTTRIPAKKITGITGLSGCGKTTLMDILTGLLKTEGQALKLDGEPLTADLQAAWRQSLGYLPQDSFFIDGTLRENLVWDSRETISDEDIHEALKQVNAYGLVSGLQDGLDTYIANYQYHFSGGERQRLALARVLLRKPKLLLLDEATSALDTENEKLIMDCLIRLKEHVTIVFVTHREYLKCHFDDIIDLKATK